MAYSTMKKLIATKNAQYNKGNVTQYEYEMWKNSQVSKLDVFLACDRITDEQYSELMDMFLTFDE